MWKARIPKFVGGDALVVWAIWMVVVKDEDEEEEEEG